MSTVSPINGLPIPDKDSPNLPPIHFQAWSDVLDSRVLARFASAADRDTTIASPVNGMSCWTDDAGFWDCLANGTWTARQTSKPGRRLIRATAQTVASSQWVPITWDNAADTPAGAGMWNLATPTRLIVTKTGRWRATFNCTSTNNIMMRANAAGTATGGFALGAVGGTESLAVDEVALTAGDYIEGFVFQTTAGPVGGTTPYISQMTLSYIDAS